MSELLTVLLADDHPLFRKGLRALLATVPHLRVVGEAASGSEAVRFAKDLRPNLVLMDLQMPGGDGLSAIREIAATIENTHVLVVTMFEDDDSVFAAMKAGARGYVLKDMDDAEMLRAILAVGHGEAIFSATIASRMITFFTSQAAKPQTLFPDLIESEYRLLRLMARGLKNDDIARQLGLSPKTVRNYVSNIFSKLQVTDRAQAVVRARDAGVA